MLKQYNKVEYDFDLWSWHGIEEDIMNAWCKRFGEDVVGSTLNNLREWLKDKPKFQEVIDKGYGGNWVFFLWDSFERGEKWRREREGDGNER